MLTIESYKLLTGQLISGLEKKFRESFQALEARLAGVESRTPLVGDPGPEGPAGKDAVVDEEKLITEIHKRIPVPKDGKDGRDGKDGLPGPQGLAGRDGRDGASPVLDYGKLASELRPMLAREDEADGMTAVEMAALYEAEGKKYFGLSADAAATINLSPEIRITPVINMPQIKQDAPVVNVSVPEPAVAIENRIELPSPSGRKVRTVERDERGQISRVIEDDGRA